MIKKLFSTSPFLLLTFLLAGCVSTSSLGGSPLFPTPAPPKTGPVGQYCLTKDELNAIKSRPIAFTCDRTNLDRTTIIETNVPYVLAAEDVEVKRIFIHVEKQLILKEICDGINYYTWKCHPPSHGSIYSNTLWRLRDTDSNRAPLKNHDHFDVYIRKDVKDTEKFVCQNQAGDATIQAQAQPLAKILADSPLRGEIINISGKRAFWYMRSDAQKMDIEDASPREWKGEVKIKDVFYDVFVNLLKAFSPDEDKNFYLVEKGELPKGNDGLPDSITYDVFSIVTEVKPKGLTLQLGTFSPALPKSRWFNIYLPESKPVIYLYPERSTKLTVKLNPAGRLTVSDPPYDPEKGWEVIAYPNGKIQQLNNEATRLAARQMEQSRAYPYLYYESEVRGYEIPKEGIIIEKESLGEFFQETLPELGLRGKEIADFSDYWLGRLLPLNKPFFFVTFLPQEQIEKIDPLIIRPISQTTKQSDSAPDGAGPDSSIRIRVYFKPLDKPIEISPQISSIPPERRGFTVVEWGGILDD
jgi:hypothetical protein